VFPAVTTSGDVLCGVRGSTRRVAATVRAWRRRHPVRRANPTLPV